MTGCVSPSRANVSRLLVPVYVAEGFFGFLAIATTGELDWANQPFPFRHYFAHKSDVREAKEETGARAVTDLHNIVPLWLPTAEYARNLNNTFPFARLVGASLPRQAQAGPAGAPQAQHPPRFPASSSPVAAETISLLFFYSLSLSAWKQSSPRNKWSLRTNASSGNLVRWRLRFVPRRAAPRWG